MWAYNTQPYFESVGQTASQIGTYMSWVPLVGGSIGVILGGKVSDFLMKRMGLVARVFVLTVSQVSGLEGCVCICLSNFVSYRLFCIAIYLKGCSVFVCIREAPSSFCLL